MLKVVQRIGSGVYFDFMNNIDIVITAKIYLIVFIVFP